MTYSESIDFREVSNGDMDMQQAASSFIQQASDLGASDIFLQSDEDSLRVVIRRIGLLEELGKLSRDQGRSLINYVKVQAGCNITEKRRPQEGRWIHNLEEGGAIDLRISVIPTLHGEDVAARLLDRKRGLRTINEIGLGKAERAKVVNLLSHHSGLILVTGPMGTGKTTTLYACLQHLNSRLRRINTLEDPIEYQLDGIRQSQVQAKIGVDFPEMLRNVLRQSPDVIMIGEIRDEETAATAVRAAGSGHLVLATMHAPVAASAIQTMRAMKANPYFFAGALRGIISQRLVRRLCVGCRQAFDISNSPETFSDIKSLLEPSEGNYIYGPLGCNQCRHQGYIGQVGVFEIMTMNRELRNMILESKPVEDLHRAAVAAGMIEFHRSAMVKVAQGLTTMEEVLREIPAESLGLEG